MSNYAINIEAHGVSRGMPACLDGNYYKKNTVIPLGVKLSDYKYLYFICGEDSAEAGVQTIVVPLQTGRIHHRLTWDISDGILRPTTKVFQCLIVRIDENNNTVTITDSNVTDYGIQKILAG